MEVRQNPFLYDTSIKQVKRTNTVTNSIKSNSLERTVNQDIVSFSSSKKSELRKEFEKVKSQQSGIGKAWDFVKNVFGAKSGSNKVEELIKQTEKGEISEEEAKQAIANYEEGQKTCVDVVADMASGILAVGAFALAVPTGGASLAVGLTMATAVGAGVKTGIKVWDAKATGKEYNGKDLLYDVATGGINGLLAPVTNGLGNTVTKTIGQKLGLKIVKEGAEEVAEQAVKQGFKQAAKSAVLNQTLDVAGGTIGKRAVALGAGMAVDGALGGASDNMVRATLNGENIIKAGVEGAIGGMIMAPVIGGSFRVAGKAGRALNNKITTSIVLPDGLSTKFNQGKVGDCALLSTIDGMMNNPQTANNIKKSITKTIGGDYNVKIGDQVVRVAKSSLSDEMLSDKTGIRIFEQAYKQLTGDINGGFAEVVAKQFGLNPVHITIDSITDELLDKLAKNQGDTVLSFGSFVDEVGQISETGQRHYFTIKNIDPETKMVTLTSPVDTSVEIPMSYDQIKTMGISIDGGTTKPMDLPNATRSADDVEFRGKNAPKTKGIISQNYIENLVQEGKIPEGMTVLENGTIVVNTPAARGDAYYAVFIPNQNKQGGYWFDSRYATEGYGFIESNTSIKDLYFSKLDINANGKEIVKSMKENGFKGEALHAVRMTVDGKEYLFCYDNRRLSAAIQCKMESLPVVIHDSTEPFRKGDPLCGKTWGSQMIELLKNFIHLVLARILLIHLLDCHLKRFMNYLHIEIHVETSNPNLGNN